MITPEDFMDDKPVWGSDVEKERRNRIKLSVAALSYETYSVSIMSDSDFDRLALEINPQMPTGNTILDKFFVEQFSPDTGQWIHKHPDKAGLERIFFTHYAKKKKGKKK